ncbi:paralemmin-3 [Tenrec ecaudatus]|uniref:paralemmin-3 n=1 Tax=Tenrec ecaudatus TaxID=94439 RepID=UPI003F594215
MDRAAEGQDWPKDPTSQDSQSPEGQAQARIQNLEDSLFTLQSQLQLLQSASTGAQRKPSWRRQGHRPLSQTALEASPADAADADKRASLPPSLAGMSPESPSEPSEEAASRQAPGVMGPSSEANGPCPGPSSPLEGAAVAERGVDEAKGGGVVEVVWEGLRATEDCATGASGPELEAKVEEVVLAAIGDRQVAGSPELPSWVKEDREVVEVVWEGVGGMEGSDSEHTRAGGSGQEATQLSSPRLPEQLRETASRKGSEACRSSPEGNGQGGSGGEEGSFIWVERVALSEEWEELLVEGLEGPVGREAGDGGLLGSEKAGSEETWEVERRRAEEPQGVEDQGSERDGAEEPPGVEQQGDEGEPGTERSRAEGSPKTEEAGREEQPGAEKRAEDAQEGEIAEAGGSLRAEESGEEQPGAEEKAGGEALGDEKAGGEVQPEVEQRAEEPGEAEQTPGGGDALEEESKGGEEVEQRGEAPLEAEKTQGAEEGQNAEESAESQGAKAPEAEEVGEAGAPGEAKEELQPEEKQEGPPEEEAANPQTSAEDQGPAGDATPLQAETTPSEQPSERQPLLPVEGPCANTTTTTAHPAPTYAPARQPEPPAPTEGEEASGPKQKTCQCCAVM